MTSYATRTSPVVRGKWLLENILGAPPPPPPPDVPELPEGGDGGKATSVRERMERHRSNPVCASCHAQMDPLGFALENFDAVGRWRTMSEGNTPIDASGALPDGTKFDGPAELRQLLASRRDEFVRTVIEKMLVYALGRGLEYYDMPTVRRIQREAARRRLPLVVAHPGDRRKHAFSDAEVGIMIVTRKTVARRTVLRGLGAAVSLPLLDAMVPALTALAQTPAKSRGALRRRLRADGRGDEQLDARGNRRRASRSARSSSRSASSAIACSC